LVGVEIGVKNNPLPYVAINPRKDALIFDNDEIFVFVSSPKPHDSDPKYKPEESEHTVDMNVPSSNRSKDEIL